MRTELSTLLGRWPASTLIVLCLLSSVASAADPRLGEFVPRRGDEIVVCGRFVHTTAPVVLWVDPGGYDAYRIEDRFSSPDRAAETKSSEKRVRRPNRYAMRRVALTDDQREQVRGGGWDLPLLREFVDQFVIHYDQAGSSRRCFQVLHDERGLSAHFLLDLDGTIYQTLDVKEGAWHATIANPRSIGVEIANVGAYPPEGPDPFARYYRTDADGTRLIVPDSSEAGPASRGRTLRPSRPAPIEGTIQGRRLRQYDLTDPQYDSLIRLTATLCTLFPRIRCDYPRDESGRLVPRKLPDDELKRYNGLLGHYHVQTNKVDPGPAFQWDRVVEGARVLIRAGK